jgi:hypothetical protein
MNRAATEPEQSEEDRRASLPPGDTGVDPGDADGTGSDGMTGVDGTPADDNDAPSG